jgi:hypothetical protein
LRVHVIRADESTVVNGPTEEQPAVPGEQLPFFGAGPGGELDVIDVWFVGCVDAEQAHPSRQRAEVHVEQEATRVRLRSLARFDIEN